MQNSLLPKYKNNKYLKPFKQAYGRYVAPSGNSTFVDIRYYYYYYYHLLLLINTTATATATATTTTTTIRLPIDAFSPEGEEWLVGARKVLDEINQELEDNEAWKDRGGVKIYLGEGGTLNYDAIQVRIIIH